jgi:hypothetical protein
MNTKAIDEICVCGHSLSEHKNRKSCKFCKREKCDTFRFVAFLLDVDVAAPKQTEVVR